MSDRTDDIVQRVLAGIPSRPIPDLAPGVMERIAALPDHAAPAKRQFSLSWLANWLLTPRPLSLQWRPAYAFALLAFLAATPLVTRGGETQAAAHPQQVLVQVRLDAPDASRVQLAGNFTNWKPSVAMKRTGSGVWTVVLPLDAGVHNYAFIVDGEQWTPDPMAPAVSDGFGGMNSQLAVLTPDPGASL